MCILIYLMLPLFCNDVYGQFEEVTSTACFYPAPLKANAERFCYNDGSRLFADNFDANEQVDLLCLNNITKSITVYYDLSKISTQVFHYCTEDKTQLLRADFNGDNIKDLLCARNEGDNHLMIVDIGKSGEISDSTTTVISFCTGNTSKLYIGDFNGDRKTDILCRNKNGRLAVKTTDGASWNLGFNFCNSDEDNLILGDFNGDGRTDLLCHNRMKDLQIRLADRTGNRNNFYRTQNNVGSNWCKMKSSLIKVADINGDGFDDLICKDLSPNGKIYVSKNYPYQYFRNGITYSFYFCLYGGDKNFFVGDFNGDKKDDIMCQTAIGTRQIIVSHCG